MTYESLTVLIPSHSLEDFPLELTEQPAEGLLNAFAVLWHPMLLNAAGVLPNWERADEPPSAVANRLIIVPTASDDWVPCTWIEDARHGGGHVISGVTERAALVEQALAPLKVEQQVDPELVADFLALGHCHLQVELLTRQMRHYASLDEVRLESSALAAAKAALAADRPATESHLRSCFEMLLEGRERFYPVDCYLTDLCLVSAQEADESFSRVVRSDWTVNYLAPAAEWEQIAHEHPDELARLKERWSHEEVELLGGEWREVCSVLRSQEWLLWQFQRGLAEFDRLFGRRPRTWGRRRFGVGPHLPQVLDKLGYDAALHFVMDDGLYPDEEQGKFRWEGAGGSVIDATSRIPLAADSAASFLRFPLRMSETMDYDHAAIVTFARWPKMRTPWLEDFHRMHRYAPVLGRFVTFSEFFRGTDTPGRLSSFKAGEYLSPYLVYEVARQQADPIGRYVDDWRRHHRYEAAAWQAAMASILRSGHEDTASVAERDEIIASAGPDAESEVQQAAESFLREVARTAQRELGAALVGEGGSSGGCLLINPLSFPRRTVVPLGDQPVPQSERVDAVVAVHVGRISNPSESSGSSAKDADGLEIRPTAALIVDLPPCGFVWLPAAPEGESPHVVPHKTPMAEGLVVRNETFEVRLSEVTGGIAQIKSYRRSPNRLSQQLAFRFPRERTLTYGEGDETEHVRTYYSEMRLNSARILSAGPTLGEIETTGEIVDQQTSALLAEYRQRTRVRRGLPMIEVDVELDVQRMPEGDPWSNYFAARFAWNDPDAALTASMHEGAHAVTGERLEAPHFIEIASEGLRTTLFPMGLPFHRKTGSRMLDTLLITAAETRRTFHMAVSIDEEFPMQRARDLMAPVEAAALPSGSAAPASGWLFHLDARNVQLTRLLPMPGSSEESGFVARLRETEGRHRTVRLRCFRAPAAAAQIDFRGEKITDLTIDGDTVLVEVTPYEICDVALHFS